MSLLLLFANAAPAGGSSSTTQDVRTTGQNTAATSQDTRATGTSTANQPQDVRTTGTATNNAAKDVRTTGQATTSTSQDIRATGSATSTVAKDVRATGTATSSSSQDTRLTGSAAVFATKKVVHIGSQSGDVHTNTQAEINAVITALVTAMPSITHIAINTYMDYASGSANDQYVKWATAIHAAGKKLWARSNGFNDWIGSNGVTQYTSADFAAHHRSQMVTWINANYGIFQSGDIFQPTPDEPENNSMWNTTYGTIGSGAGQTAYNGFITGSISDANTAFANHAVVGVTTSYVGTNPSASKDVIDSTTASGLTALLTDHYPESGLTTAASMASAMTTELNTYVVPNKPTVFKHITYGPSVYTQLTEAVQADAITQEYQAIQDLLSATLDGITIWQFGATDNAPKSRLFDWNGTNWVARSATTALNTLLTSSSTSRDVRATGTATSNVAKDVRTTGQLITSTATDVRASGSTGSNTATDVRTTGTSTNSIAKDVRATGQLTSSSATDVRTTGTSTSNVAKDVRTTGQFTSNVAQDVRASGKATSSAQPDVRVTGTATSNVAKDIRATGQLTSSTSQDVRVTANATGTTTQDVRVTGVAGSTTSVDVRVVGQAPPALTSSKTVDIRVSGSLDSSTSTTVRLVGYNGYDFPVNNPNTAGTWTTDTDVPATIASYLADGMNITSSTFTSSSTNTATFTADTDVPSTAATWTPDTDITT